MRGFRTLALVVVAFAMSVGFSTAQSLAELAKKEKERRDKNPSETKRVITENDLARSFGGVPAGLETPAQTQGGEGETAAAESDADESEEPVDETKTQEYWQNRMKGAKDKIARLEQRLSSDDWGEGLRVGIDPLGQNNLAAREKESQELAAARAELEAIRAEARRAGVPPGWVR